MQNKKIKVLFTIPNFDSAGSGKALLNVAMGLNKEQFEPHILCLHKRGAFFETVEKSGIPIYVFDYLPPEVPLWKMLLKCFVVAGKFRKINPTIIHSFNYSSNYTEGLSARIAGIKWVFTKKNMSWGGGSKRYWNLRSSFATKIAVQNSDMIKQFYAESKKTYLLPRGVAAVKFAPSLPKEEIRNQMKTSSDKRIIICVANFVPVKGIELLIDAFDSLKNQYPNWMVWLVGDTNNEYGVELLELVKHKKLEDKIIFSGKKSNVIDYLNHAEIFVLPTKDEGRREGTPVAMLEAMANSKVVIGSAIPGINDQLRNFPNHLFEAANTNELKNKLEVFMKNTIEENKNIGNQFKNLVESEFTIENEIRNHELLYLSILK